MKIRDPKSIMLIVAYVTLNGVIIFLGLRETPLSLVEKRNAAPVAPEYTQINNLDYFTLKDAKPFLSLNASEMKSLGEESAYFKNPTGLYHYKDSSDSLSYKALEAFYKKDIASLKLLGDVELFNLDARYTGSDLTYFTDKDLVEGVNGVVFEGRDPKTQDFIKVTSKKFNSQPKKEISQFEGNVVGNIIPKKKYQTSMTFNSEYLKLHKEKSHAELWGGVKLNRGSYLITGGNAQFFLQNSNKSLKYFVLNDDVRVTETLRTPEGVIQRRSFSESLEGLGSEKKMILSGAPRVEQGKDIIKGYRITIRENAELIEVDDAMSDVQVKRKKN